MEIIKIDVFKDGGTISITTDVVEYCIDSRLFTSTKGSIFHGYPKKDNSNIVEDQKTIRQDIIDSIDRYSLGDGVIDFRPSVYELLNVFKIEDIDINLIRKSEWFRFDKPIEEPEIEWGGKVYDIERLETLDGTTIWFGKNTNWKKTKNGEWTKLIKGEFLLCEAPIYERAYWRFKEK